MTRPLVLYHQNCADGFCAAFIAHKKLGDTADYLPVQYGQEPPAVAGRRLFILDFSYKRPVMRQILSQAHAVVVLDHHKTAEAELAGIVDEFVQRPDLIQNPPGSELPVVRFDMEKSGGRLTWEYFFPGKGAPWLVNYTESRDLWTFHLPFSREISAVIGSYPMSFAVWDSLEEALNNDPTNLRNLRNCVPETAADFTQRKAKEVLFAGMPLSKNAG